MSTELSFLRRIQIREAHAALTHGNKALAQDLMGADLDGMVGRIAAALRRLDPGAFGENSKNRERKTRSTPPTNSTFKRAGVRAILERQPAMATKVIAERVGCSMELVARIRTAMGLPHPPTRGRNVKAKAIDILAEHPQISNSDLAKRIGASIRYVRDVRRIIGGN